MAKRDFNDLAGPLLKDYDGAESGRGKGASPILSKRRRGHGRRRRPLIRHLGFFVFALTMIWIALFSAIYSFDVADKIPASVRLAFTRVHNVIWGSYYRILHPHCDREVAEAMTEFYELLAKMDYFEPELIDRPPHVEPGINTTLARVLGFSPRAITMMQMLPYLAQIDEDGEDRFHWSGGDGDEFIMYGRFSDMRIDEELLESRDPFGAWRGSGDEEGGAWDDPDGKYMRPDYICLNLLGNHGVVMILNVANCKLWTIDQELGNADYALKDFDRPLSPNQNSLENYPSRPALNALRDYMAKFTSLEWMPGSLWKETWDGDNYARLYVESGWPDHFDRTAFATARAAWEAEESERSSAEEPFRRVDEVEATLAHNEALLARITDEIMPLVKWATGPVPEPWCHAEDQGDTKESCMAYYGNKIEEVKEEIRKQKERLATVIRDAEKADVKVWKAREERKKKYGYAL